MEEVQIIVNEVAEQINVTVNETPEEVAIIVNEQQDGLSAYQLAVLDGYTGTEAQWLDSLKINVAGGISTAMVITQSDYDNLTPEETTLYFIPKI